jgi:hypothetical protein
VRRAFSLCSRTQIVSKLFAQLTHQSRQSSYIERMALYSFPISGFLPQNAWYTLKCPIYPPNIHNFTYSILSLSNNSSLSITASSNSSPVVTASESSVAVAFSVFSSLCRSKLRISSSLSILSILPLLTPILVSLLPLSMILSILSLLARNLSFGNALCCPTCSMRASCFGFGSLKIRQKSEMMERGQIVMVPENSWSQISLQSWPKGRGRSSRWRTTLSHLLRSSLRYCSVALPKKPPRQPRPRRWVTGCPTGPREEKKKRLMCGLTCETMLKFTLKVQV